jgi:hypothetical protein
MYTTSGTYRVHSPQFFARGSDVLQVSTLVMESNGVPFYVTDTGQRLDLESGDL